MRLIPTLVAAALLTLPAAARAQERLPHEVAGTWRITRILPVRANACWTEKEAEPLVGSLLQYTPSMMRWRGGSVPLTGITTRSVTSDDLAREATIKLTDLGIHADGVTEVNLQHDDADITGATTEVPGDSVLLAGPGRIIVSACGVYMEARRTAPTHAATAEGTRKGL